jgi:hypothetical protein
MKKISSKDSVRNEVVLRRVKKDRNVLQITKKKKKG